MSLSAMLFGRNSLIFKATNVLGLGIPGWLDKKLGPAGAPGQALGEIAQQTAKEAEPRVIVWGRVRPIGGNLIHCQVPVKRWVKQSTGGGKGGGSKKKQKVEHVYRTYAIGVCEGPITAFSRIWRNNKLVYDARGNDWGARNNGVFLRAFRLYLGSWSQMPSPDLEAIWGAGNVPAYRGTAYLVAVDEDLTELGGSVPQWLFEVERAEGSFLTSRPYAVEAVEAAAGTGSTLDRAHIPPPPYVLQEASGSLGSMLIGGDLRYPPTQSLAEGLTAVSVITRGALRSPPTPALTEALASNGSAIVEGSLKLAIFYPYTPEALTTNGSAITGGTLS